MYSNITGMLRIVSPMKKIVIAFVVMRKSDAPMPNYLLMCLISNYSRNTSLSAT